jgi:hypothetical protein
MKGKKLNNNTQPHIITEKDILDGLKKIKSWPITFSEPPIMNWPKQNHRFIKSQTS